MQIQMRGNKIGVQKLGKASQGNKSTLIVMPESGDALGVIKFLGVDAPKDLEVGMKIYYGTSRQQVKMSGMDIEVMEDDNIYAIAKDSDEETKS